MQEQFSPAKAETAIALLLFSAPSVQKKKKKNVFNGFQHRDRTGSTSQKGDKNQSNQLMPSHSNECRRDKMLSDLVACLKLAGFLSPVASSRRVRVSACPQLPSFVWGCVCACVYMPRVLMYLCVCVRVEKFTIEWLHSTVRSAL